MANKKIVFTNHIYSYNCKINGKEYNSIATDDVIRALINNVYNDSDPSEVLIRANLRKLLNGQVPGVVINDLKDGGVTTIKIIR